VPKGSPIANAGPHRTAEIEAYEEAGVVGKISSRPLGRYVHRKKKSGRGHHRETAVFSMEVHAQKRRWPEKGERDIVWLPASEAAERVHRPGCAV
jgi:8-oxo-dGTP pyrophosphatase MutT (NUDIX family)